MGQTLASQAVTFANQLDASTRQADMLDANTHGMQAAYERLAEAMEELGIPMHGEPEEPISHEQASATAEHLYHGLISHAGEDHMKIRLAQAMNRAWAELTVSEGLDRIMRSVPADELPNSR